MSTEKEHRRPAKGADALQGVCPTKGVAGHTHHTRAVVYLRVSTQEQVERGLGLATQLSACRAQAEALQLSVVAVERDEGVSGAEGLDSRQGLVAVINHLRTGNADTVIVFRLDRLARDVILQETLLQQIWLSGAQVVSCSAQETELARPDDGEDPARTLVRQILAAVSQYERAMIRLRMRSGKRRAASERVFAGGTIPFGWEADKATRMGLREVWTEQATLQRAARLHDVDGSAWPEVAALLNAEGLGRRHAKAWDAQSVRRAVAADRKLRDELARLRAR